MTKKVVFILILFVSTLVAGDDKIMHFITPYSDNGSRLVIGGGVKPKKDGVGGESSIAYEVDEYKLRSQIDCSNSFNGAHPTFKFSINKKF